MKANEWGLDKLQREQVQDRDKRWEREQEKETEGEE